MLVTAIVILSFLGLSLAVNKVRRMSAVAGTQALVGKVAVARTPLTPDGYVFLQGERWRAEMEDGAAEAGERVRVTGAAGLRLRVQKEKKP